MTYKKLINILQIPHGNSQQEDNVRNFIKSQVPNIKEDTIGNLYLINKNTPIVCAHMDNVGSKEAQKNLHKIQYQDGIIKGTHNMGADDKVGIYIALELYDIFKDSISLLFTVGEEMGAIGANALNKNIIKENTYCIIPDRRGGGDVIGVNNSYCTQEFEDLIMKTLSKYGFNTNTGLFCDADVLRYSINCFNISCGYYNPHTDSEYVNYKETLNTIKALMDLINCNIPKMRHNEYIRYRYSDYRYGWYDYYYEETNISLPRGGYAISERGDVINLHPGKWTIFGY